MKKSWRGFLGAGDKAKGCLLQSVLKASSLTVGGGLSKSVETLPFSGGKPCVGLIPSVPEGLRPFDSNGNHGFNGEEGLEERSKGYLPQARRAANHLPDPAVLFSIGNEVLEKGHLAEPKSYFPKPLNHFPIFDGHGQKVDALLEKGEIEAMGPCHLLEPARESECVELPGAMVQGMADLVMNSTLDDGSGDPS